MANRWGKVGEVIDFIFLDSKITVDGNYRHEIKRHLLLGREAMTNLDNLLKSRDITLGPYSQSYGFSSSHVQMWELVHKRIEHQRIDTFELGCWRRLLRVPWTTRKFNQSNLKEINAENLLEGLKLKLQYFGHLMWRNNSLEKTLILGMIGGKRKRGQHRMKWLDSTTDSMDTNLSKLWERVEDRGAWHGAVH